MWRWALNSQRKLTKIPYQARNPDGEPARSNDPSTWADHDSAWEAVEAGKANGIGFVLTDTPFAAFDLDDCFIEGAAGDEVSSWAMKLIEDAGSYIENTPSGSGLRIIGTAQGNPIHCTFPMPDGGSLEIYRKATRYITITGLCDDEFNKLINIDAVMDATVLRRKPGLADRKNAKPKEVGKAVSLYTQAEAELIISALSVIPADKYDNWFKIGAAVRSTGWGEAARQIWDDWSRTCPEKFDEAAQERTWQSFDRPYDGKKITLGTLFALAKEHGWKKPTSLGETVVDEKTAKIVEQLASLSRIEYDQVRAGNAEKLNIRVATLDKLVDDFRPAKEGQGHALSLLKLEPWPHRVDGAELVDEIAREIHRFVILSAAEANTIALWCLASHACRAFRIFPRLFFKSPSPECGKTTLMDVVAPFVDKGLQAEHSTTAALFRIIEQEMPTVFLDEADSFVKDNEEMRGIINSGHKRDGKVLRVVGEAMEPRAFNTFCPMVIAAIGRLPATIEGRSIIIGLKRRLPTEHVVRFSDEEGDRIRDSLGRKCARFAADNLSALSSSNPDVPQTLSNRKADNWRPLLAVADLAGGGVPDLARKAAAALSSKASDDDGQASPATMLLADLREMFQALDADPSLFKNLNPSFSNVSWRRPAQPRDRAKSEDVAAYLNSLTDRPWPGWNWGRGINPSGVSKLLKDYGIKPDVIRIGETTHRGYCSTWFVEAFDRYLPKPEPDNLETESIFTEML